MKSLLLALVLSLAAGCTTRTEYGECKGFFDKDEEDPKLKYEVNTGNIVGALIFSETLAIPILVGGLWVFCPMAKIEGK